MPKPRPAQIAIEETPYYHLVSRCVRRAFLCGCTETYNFAHRRGWILERLSLLTQMFAIDVAAFALMSNHYHLVVRVDSERAKLWSAVEVVQHWQLLFRLPALVEQYLSSALQSAAELQVVEKFVETWRCRLMDIS